MRKILIKLAILTAIATGLLAVFYLIKQEDATLMWSNGFGLTYLLMLLMSVFTFLIFSYDFANENVIAETEIYYAKFIEKQTDKELQFEVISVENQNSDYSDKLLNIELFENIDLEKQRYFKIKLTYLPNRHSIEIAPSKEAKKHFSDIDLEKKYKNSPIFKHVE